MYTVLATKAGASLLSNSSLLSTNRCRITRGKQSRDFTKLSDHVNFIFQGVDILYAAFFQSEVR